MDDMMCGLDILDGGEKARPLPRKKQKKTKKKKKNESRANPRAYLTNERIKRVRSRGIG